MSEKQRKNIFFKLKFFFSIPHPRLWNVNAQWAEGFLPSECPLELESIGKCCQDSKHPSHYFDPLLSFHS